MTTARDARLFLRARHVAALATHSVRMPGYPFGSAVPYALDDHARPVVLVSTLAEHTRNLAADSRASLLVQDAAHDVQAAPRLTLVGDAAPLPPGDPAGRRYLRRFPESARLLALGDFSYRVISVREALFVRGFGRIDWVTGTEFAPPPNRIAEAEEEILAHMNAEHADALILYCSALAGVRTSGATMVGVDCDGFDVRAGVERGAGKGGDKGGLLLRFDFDAPATDAESVRAALIALGARARSG
jgi:putative heme iron utilization protein